MKDMQQQRRMRQLDERGRPQAERFGQNNKKMLRWRSKGRQEARLALELSRR